MRIFDAGNWTTDVCAICKTKKDGQVTLIGIQGTEEGGNIQAKQVHVNCLELTMIKTRSGNRFIVQQLGVE